MASRSRRSPKPGPRRRLTPILGAVAPLPGFAAAPPAGLAIPGFTPAGQTPALPGFGAVEPGVTGPQVLESRTLPTGGVTGTLTGVPPTDLPSVASPEQRAAAAIERTVNERLAAAGFNIVQQPTLGANPGLTRERLAALGLDPAKDPDQLIEGRVFDIYTPVVDSVASVLAGMRDKVDDKQTDRITLNLTEVSVTEAQVRAALTRTPIPGLKEVITVTNDGIGSILPFAGRPRLP